MGFRIYRLRGGEWIIGGSSLALLIATFALPWYGLKATFAPTAALLGQATQTDGWESYGTLRYLLVIVALLGLAVWWVQATRPGPALPVSLTVVDVALATLLLIGLIYRIAINEPGSSSNEELKIGSYAGLILTVAVLVGAYVSMREDAAAPDGASQEIETLRLAARPS